MTRHEPDMTHCIDLTPDRRSLRNLRWWSTQCRAGPQADRDTFAFVNTVEISVFTHRRY
jgi:hypothetical protein